MNPFTLLFASRYLAEDDHTLLRIFNSPVALFDQFCLESDTKKPIPPYYAQVTFKISKKESSGEWIVKTVTHETHYLSLDYFCDEGLGLSVEDYINIPETKPGKMTFKKTDKHHAFDTIVLKISRTLKYKIKVVDICYYTKNLTATNPVLHMIGYNDYLLMSPPLVSPEEPLPNGDFMLELNVY